MRSRETIKNLALDRNDEGLSTAQIADILRVSQRTIQRWIQKGRTQLPKRIPRPKSRRLTVQQGKGVLKFIEDNAGVFLDQVKDFVSETYGVSISSSTASRILSKNDVTRKRGTRVNTKYRPDRGTRFLEEVLLIYDSNPIMSASIDQMSVMLNLAPTYVYARQVVAPLSRSRARGLCRTWSRCASLRLASYTGILEMGPLTRRLLSRL